jgi:asparagine synthase (glutamine-hydrolysing)
MCGIAGFIDPKTGPEARLEAVNRMCNAMIHRGPDDAGTDSRGIATLGMRRLAIFDPANGHQPMFSPDGRFTLVFNGAIYNFLELRKELASYGREFRTNCDTEVLLAAWERWGEECLGRLRGMFAFAVWDAEKDSLHLARDPFGIKPLYYRNDGDRLLFASELNALIAAGSFSAEVDSFSVSDYLAWFAVPAPWTIYRGIFSLQPGDVAVFRDGQLTTRRAWTFRSAPDGIRPCGSRDEFTRELRIRLEDTIRAHVAADVPVGAFLSGGLDSAAIVGLMTRAAGTRLRTFSLAFDEGEYSEAGAAEATARHFGTEHTTRVLTGKEVAANMDSFLAACDQPTGDGVNTYYISQTARAGGVTVALSGLGGDELFGGYPSFRDLPRLAGWLGIWRSLPHALRMPIVSRLNRGDTRHQKLADFLVNAHDIHELNSLQRRVFSVLQVRSLLGPESREALKNRPPYHPELSELRGDLQDRSTFERISAWELRTYMANVLLRDSDVMSMRHSLEMRVPFVDRPLFEWLSRQPTAWKDTPGHPKDALAAAVADLLPPGLRERRKQGFTLPFAVWMKRELRPFIDDTFTHASINRSGLFAADATQAIWKNFLSHEDPREWSRVWSMAVLIHFVNRRQPTPQEVKVSRPVVIAEKKAAKPAPPPPPPPPAAPTKAGVPVPAPEPAPKPSPPPGPQTRSRPAPPPAPSPVSFLRPERTDKPNYRFLAMLLSPELFSSLGGISRMLSLYLKAMCDLGQEQNFGVKLVSLNDPILDSNDIRRYANDNLEDWYVCSRDKLRFTRAAVKKGRQCRVIICGHVAQLPVAWLAKIANPRIKYYLVAHGIEVWRSFNLAERLAMRGAAGILCVSEFTRREVLARTGLPAGRVTVLPNALDPYFKIRPGVPPAECAPVIVTVSRLTYGNRYKGVEHLIAAMPEVVRRVPNARLLVVGRGDDLPRLQGNAHQAGLIASGAVEFLGAIPDLQLDELLGSCRVFALPSKSEGFGLVYIEAMARGRPCVGARAGATPEIITEDTGVLADYGDISQIAAACVTALRRPWSQAPMLARAEQFSFARFKERLASYLTI